MECLRMLLIKAEFNRQKSEREPDIKDKWIWFLVEPLEKTNIYLIPEYRVKDILK